MNRKQANTLVLSETEFFDDFGREFKTYQIDSKEHKLYGELNQARLEGETQEEYKVRRIFISERSKNRGRLIWGSKNPENIKLYNVVRSLSKGEDSDKLEQFKEVAYQSNLGTFNKKKLEKLISDINKEEVND